MKTTITQTGTEKLMSKPNFRVVKRFRTLVEQERLPISNQICTGAPNLFVDDVLKRTERDMPEEVRPPRYKINPLIGLFLILFSIVGLVLLVNSMR